MNHQSNESRLGHHDGPITEAHVHDGGLTHFPGLDAVGVLKAEGRLKVDSQWKVGVGDTVLHGPWTKEESLVILFQVPHYGG